MKIKNLFIIMISLIIICSCNKSLNIELSNNILTLNGKKINLTKNEKEAISHVKISEMRDMYGLNVYILARYPIMISYNRELNKFKDIDIWFIIENKEKKIIWDKIMANINGLKLESNLDFEQIKELLKNKKFSIDKYDPFIIRFDKNDDILSIVCDKETKKIRTMQVYVNGFRD